MYVYEDVSVEASGLRINDQCRNVYIGYKLYG